ncbi:ATP-binding cassette domain-containing protein [Deinococcus xianganensis]|uniref:ATP-binding cassette domain-containing protein n=1 Tax=Deinococcus xianganensis TaxID=1507289 RepID=A0A6I4YNA3_9DEIO|nr:ABC transporter ATP-binding protein [Deinococcus xianganensis]MXV21294.1 ATP-binding cassette domain-containing protein [Deinococcus xianganensis]
MTLLWQVLGRDRRAFWMIAALETLLSATEALLHPLLLKAIFDQGIISTNFQKFILLGLGYLLLGLTLNTGVYLVGLRRKTFENRVIVRAEQHLLRRTLALDARTIQSNGSASYVSRIHNDVLEGLLPSMDLFVNLCKTGVSSVVFLGVLLYLSWQASLILLLIVPVLFAISQRLGRQIRNSTGEEREAEAHYTDVLTRTVEAFFSLRGLPQLTAPTLTRNEQALSRYLDIVRGNYRLKLQQRTSSDVIMNVSDAAAMIIGAYFVFVGQLSFGGFLAFINSLWRAVNGLFTVINLIPEFHRTAAVLERLRALESAAADTYHQPGPAVRLHDIHVDLGGAAATHLQELHLPAGDRMLLRGANGSGKSTVLRVIAGTLHPDAGTVQRPERVAALTAPVHLPPLTVQTLVPDDALLRTLGLAELRHQEPHQLSSGQRQKLGLALILSTDADLYLLDEPLANLDPDSQELLASLLLTHTQGRSTILVHHGDDLPEHAFDQIVTHRPPEARDAGIGVTSGAYGALSLQTT